MFMLSGCWEIGYMESLNRVNDLKEQGCEVKYKKNKYGIYRVKYRCTDKRIDK